LLLGQILAFNLEDLGDLDQFGDVVNDGNEVALVEVFNGLLDEWDGVLDGLQAFLEVSEFFWVLVLAFLDGLVDLGED
jgi:ABC-type uncharacterized transport system auxiliary subunit